MTQSYVSESLAQTAAAGLKIAASLSFPSCVHLNGEMAAGKTTLAKSIINGLGFQGDVTSPTYNLVQEYTVDEGVIYHMDLYRLDDPVELEFLAVKDLWGPNSLFLIEWAERGQGYLPGPDLKISISKIFCKNDFTREIILK